MFSNPTFGKENSPLLASHKRKQQLFKKATFFLRDILTYVELGEVGEDLCEAVVVVLLGELHLSHVKMPDTVDLVMLVYHCGRLPLCFG